MLESILAIVCKVLADLAGREVQPDDKLGDLGFVSLDLVEAMLNLEEAFPEAELDTYEPTEDTTAREIATRIDWKKVGK
jgi:acyl carrier protein